MSDLSIKDASVTIGDQTTTFGELDDAAHATLHWDKASGVEQGMAAIILELLTLLDRVPIVEINDSLDEPTTCKVWQRTAGGDVLRFDGVDRSVLLREERS